jgi:DnaJ-class molecular chaperone
MPDSGVLDITVPEGVADGQTLRLKGQGAPGPAAARRRALVEIRCGSTPCSSALATTSS